MEYEDIFSYIGHMGWYQIWAYLLLGCLTVFSAYQNHSITFLGYTQNHWCKEDRLQSFSHQQQRYISIPMRGNEYESCRVYDLNYSMYSDEQLLNWDRSLLQNITTKGCNAWVYDHSVFLATAASEFNLVCDRSFLVQLVSTLYTGGMLVGSFVAGVLSDKFGRLNCLLVNIILGIAVGVGGAYVRTYAGFIVTRFFTSAFINGAFLPGFVLVVELIGPRWRVETACFYHMFGSLGLMMLCGIAFFIRDFRRLQLVLAIPPAVALIFYWIIPESPRWLLVKGRNNEAEKIFNKMAVINDKTIPTPLVFEMQSESDIGQGTFFDLFKTPNIRRRILAIFLIWFTCSLMYYGLSLNTAALSGNVFLNTFINGAVEVPANLLCVLFMNKVGRRWTIGMALLLAAAAGFGQIPLIGRQNLSWLMTTLFMLGKAAVTAGFVGIYQFTAELVPTEIRNVGLGSSSAVSRVAGMGAHYVGGPLRNVWAPLPSVIFGVFSALSGLSTFTLPETLNKRIPETIEEAERFGTKRERSNEFQGACNQAFEKDSHDNIRYRSTTAQETTKL